MNAIAQSVSTPIALEPGRFRRAMGKFTTGVTVVTFEHEGQPAGMTANAFMSLSVDPPMILISARAQSRFARSVAPGQIFGVSFLAENQQALSRHFGGQPREGLADPLEWLGDTPVIAEALVQIVVRAHAIHPGGDHQIYTADVLEIRESDGPPLLFFSGKYKQVHALDPLQCWNDPFDSV